ncbi:MAG: GGDEF domain-containing protein [Clostridia bacterium]|nr:GGDEF domain-containing protein [Clostridia bacterium]
MGIRVKKKLKNKYTQYRAIRLNFISIFTIFVLVSVLSLAYISHVKKLIHENVYQNVKELSEQTAAQLNLAISDQKHIINLIVDYVNDGHLKTEEEIFDSFKNELNNYHFTRLVILDKQGNGKTSDGFLVENYPNIEEFFSEEDVYLSENRPSTVSDNQVNIYSKSISLNGKKKVLMATINTSDYKELLLRRLFGKGGTYLINSDGTVLIDSFGNIKDSNANLYEYIKNSYNLTDETQLRKIDNMAIAIKDNKEDTIDIDIHGETYYIHFERVEINDWYVITTASDTTIAKELINLVTLTAVFCLGVAFVITSIAIYINISNQRKNQKLYKVAYIDPVTLLGNEYYFRGNGSLYLERQSTKNKYLITIDINKFKALNNIHGYGFCNELLKALGQKLTNLLPADNITCRISNDIFASLFSYDDNIDELLTYIFTEASKLQVNGLDIYINLSIGAYNILPNEVDINRMLDKAYLARTQIKGLYSSSYYLFDEKLESKLIEEQKIEASMYEALEKHEFKVFYQPKTYTKNEKLYGAEALVRWYKNGKLIPPDTFIPLFEKNKFITKLDIYIFEQVCKDLSEWKNKFGVIPNISINVSKEQFSDEDFIDKYVEICSKYNLNPSEIDLEITESATIDPNMNLLKIINKIKEKGFVISIDDFGTGYSSLSMLQNLPVDIIKIDKVFVDKADLSSNKNIINYIVLMSKHLGSETIIEGVETKEQVEFIKKIGGDIIQGYYYSKPITKEEFEEYVKKDGTFWN